MVCSVSNLTGSFGSCAQDIVASDFNKDSVFWYIEKEDSIYNFKLSLCPYLSATPLKIIYPEIEALNLKTFEKVKSFPPFNANDEQSFPSLLPFSLYNLPSGAEYNIKSIDQPVLSYNSINNIFDLSFIGRFPAGVDNLAIFNYRFLKNSQTVNPYAINVYTPNQFIFSTNFADGYFSKYLDIQTYPKSIGFYVLPLSVSYLDYPCNYYPPCEDITAVHNLSNDSLKFNSASLNTLSTFANNVTFLNYVCGFTPQKDIEIVFDAAAYYFNNEKNLGTVVSSNICAARTVSIINQTGVGEGFCVYFYQLTSFNNFIGSGPATCLGYAPGSAVDVDSVNGSPMMFPYGMYGGYLGLGFDIGGGFCTRLDGKNVTGSSYPDTVQPNTITLRSSQKDNFKVLHTTDDLSEFNLVLAQEVSSVEEIEFKTYKVVLENYGKRIRASVLDCISNDFIDIFCYDVTFDNSCDTFPTILFPGISFSTSEKTCNFEIKNVSFIGTLANNDADACGRVKIPTPTPTCPVIYLTLTPTPTPSITPTITPTVTPTKTVTPTVTPTTTVTPTPTVTPAKTVTPTKTLPPTATPTITPTPTVTSTSGATPTPTTTITPTPTTTSAVTPTVTPTLTPTMTITPTPTPSSLDSCYDSQTPDAGTPGGDTYLCDFLNCKLYQTRWINTTDIPSRGGADITKIFRYLITRLTTHSSISSTNNFGGYITSTYYYVNITESAPSGAVVGNLEVSCYRTSDNAEIFHIDDLYYLKDDSVCESAIDITNFCIYQYV